MCPIRSKQRSSNTQEFLSEESSAEQREKDVCHHHRKYKAEEKFFNVLKPTENVSLASILYTCCILYRYNILGMGIEIIMRVRLHVDVHIKAMVLKRNLSWYGSELGWIM